MSTPLRWNLVIAVAGVIALASLFGFRSLRMRRAAPSPAAGSEAIATPSVAEGVPMPAPSVPPPSAASEASAEAVAGPRAGSLSCTVVFPYPPRSRKTYTYQVYLFSEDGKVDGPRSYANTERFTISGLASGRRAVFFVSTTELLSTAYQVVAVPETGSVDVTLRPALVYEMKGRVVDANRAAVGGVTVTTNESIPLPQELYLQGKPGVDASVTVAFTLPNPENPTELPGGTLIIDPVRGRIARSMITDAQGRFSVPVSSEAAPLSLSITRGPGELIKEETVLPSGGFVRIVVPVQ